MEGRGREQDLVRVWREEGGNRTWYGGKREGTGPGEGMEGRGREQDLVRVWREEREKRTW